MSPIEPTIDDETLVAFLDGELPIEEAEKLSQRMSADSELKQRVDALRTSWELLDELPSAIPNPQLAQTTIELITRGMVKSTDRGLGQILKRYRWLMLGLASTLALCLGIWSSKLQADQYTQAIIDDLAVLVNFRDLENIDSQQWLDKLASIENLEKAGLPLYINSNFPELPVASKEFETWISSLDTNQKLLLQGAYTTFSAADQNKKQTLRSIASSLTQSPTSPTVSLMRAYAGLLQRSNTEAFQIRGEEDLDKREELIRGVVRRELAIGYANHLSENEKSRIIDWCDDLKGKNLYFLNSDDPDAEIVRLLDVESVDSMIQTEDIERLIGCVELEGQELLQSLTESLQTKVLKLWVYNSLPSSQPKPQYTSDELLFRFHKLPLERQNELIYAPGNEVIRMLSEDPHRPDRADTGQ